MKEDNEYCEKHCKGYRDTGGRCFADGRYDAYWEYQKQKGTMKEKQKDELLKHVVGAIGAIKAQFEVEVIKDYEIPPLVNTKTMQDIGFGVKLQLNTRYDYDEEMLTQWKNMLKADEWYISVKRNQLHVTFKVRYKEG